MNRRNFLKIIGYTAAGAMVPLKLIAGETKQGLANGNIRLSITEGGVKDYWYFEIPVDKAIKYNRLTYTTIEIINITAYEEFQLNRIDFRVPNDIYELFANIGLHREWVELPSCCPSLIAKDVDLTITFTDNSVLSIS